MNSAYYSHVLRRIQDIPPGGEIEETRAIAEAFLPHNYHISKYDDDPRWVVIEHPTAYQCYEGGSIGRGAGTTLHRCESWEAAMVCVLSLECRKAHEREMEQLQWTLALEHAKHQASQRWYHRWWKCVTDAVSIMVSANG